VVANQLAGHVDSIDRCGRFGYTVCPTGRSDWSDRPVGRSLGRADQSARRLESCKRFIRLVGQTSRTDRSVRQSYRVNVQLVLTHYSKLRASILTKLGWCDHLQLIKIWPSRAPGKGIGGGAKIFGPAFLLRPPARSVCVSLSPFS